MGDEFKDVNVNEPITLNLSLDLIPIGGLQTIFGFDGSKSGSTFSVVVETADVVSGAPAYPKIPILDQPWWQFRKRRAVITERARLINIWEQEYAAWVRDGKPDREVLIRRYIPNAKITEA